MKMRLAFPEMDNAVVAEAISRVEDIEAVPAEGLAEACQLVASGKADGLVAGIDYTSREVILACREIIGVEGKTFSASFVLTKGSQTYVLGDAAACKNPTPEQLYDIILQTYATARVVLNTEPKVAVLSFSTFGSGGRDESIEKIQAAIERARIAHPEIAIDGEMQLDAAVNPAVAERKARGRSSVAGGANVLIAPDLNVGNILYKAMEQFGGFVAAGPILQGFKAPCSDLSRGSTVEDVVAVIEVLKRSKR